MNKRARNRLHTAVFMLFFNLGAIGAIFYFSWTGLVVGLIFWFIANCPGVGVGFHRLLTHRGFETPKWVEKILTRLGCLALQGSPTHWVAVHRKHHQYTDQPGLDPHTPREGFSWAQWGWMLLPNPSVETDIIDKYAPDLAKDEFHRRVHKTWWVPTTIVGVMLFGIGLFFSLTFAFSLLLWGVIVPVAIGWQITWLVNSVTHLWGSRPFKTGDDSTNNWWVAILTFGEGWHNNHHAFPKSVRHGLVWYEIDMNYYLICMFELCTLADDLKLPEPSMIEAKLAEA